MSVEVYPSASAFCIHFLSHCTAHCFESPIYPFGPKGLPEGAAATVLEMPAADAAQTGLVAAVVSIILLHNGEAKAGARKISFCIHRRSQFVAACRRAVDSAKVARNRRTGHGPPSVWQRQGTLCAPAAPHHCPLGSSFLFSYRFILWIIVEVTACLGPVCNLAWA
eukprot:SAG31_NODE_4418_length_3251_cov_5.297313_5_plen_166_part_00